MYKTVLFDLDGTLLDSGLGITNCVMYALEKKGIIEHDRNKLYQFIGPPLVDSFMNFYGYDRENAEKMVEYYRERYNTKGMYENEIYEGVEDMLKTLNKQGVDLIVATSKPEWISKKILEHFGLAKYFMDIYGSDDTPERATKGKVIAYALRSYQSLVGQSMEDITKQALMVGDRFHDIEGAKENGLDSLGVIYGYGSRKEFEEHGATFIVEKAETIVEIVCK